MRRPTILFMNRVYPPVRGATGRVLQDLAVSFAREGWHVTVISSGPKAGEERQDGVRILRVKGAVRPSGARAYFWIWFKMLLLALRLKGRHILVTMTDPPLLILVGQFVAKLKRSRHINWCQDLYPDVMPALGFRMPVLLMRWFRRLRIKAMKRCDKVIVCGRCMVKHLTQEGVDAQKIAMVANWPDMELTDPEMVDVTGVPYQEPDSDIVRPFEKQVKAESRFRVLYAGNMGLAHPIETILAAAEIFEEQGSDIEFVFVGDGARFDYIAAVRSEKCLDNIRLLPFQPVSRLREIMESGDVHLITMKEDAAGLVVPCKLYSALAVARPSIFVGPVQSEVAKVIRDFSTGLVVATDDVDNLVNAIKHFRESGEAWFEAHRGAVQAREVFTPQKSIEAWMDCAWDVVKDDLET
ncbi:MAG: glycosyltransferase WbuB [Alphaproteobacteria bacterium]|nr:MAG: glycosyltransferase WbuB [Alphaproteobacteria bacterium]